MSHLDLEIMSDMKHTLTFWIPYSTYYAELAVTLKAYHNIRAHHVDRVNRQWLSGDQAVSLNFVFHRLRAGGSA